MKRVLVVCSFLVTGVVGAATAVNVWRHSQMNSVEHPGWNAERTEYRLPNGWSVSPVGRTVQLAGDMPTAILVSPDSTKAIVTTSGFHDHSLSVVDLGTGNMTESLIFPKSWIGLTQHPSGDYLVSSGKADGGDLILRVSESEGVLKQIPGFKSSEIPAASQFISSILVDGSGTTYALNIQTDQLLKFDSNGQLLGSTKVGYRPYGLAFLHGGKQVAVSNWGDESVSVLDTGTLGLVRTVKVGPHPCSLAVGRDGRIFVAEAADATVSVIGASGVEETIRTGLRLGQRVGSTPVALALNPVEGILYVADAGDNCVSVVDVATPGHSKVQGLIPTDRYPSALALTLDGKKLLIATAKGDYGPNVLDPNVPTPGRRGNHAYIGDQLSGRLAIVDVPDNATLQTYTAQVLKNSDHGQTKLISASDRRAIERDAFHKIHHVIYVIKENRTYDQVLGDISKGNGSPDLTIFGESVTPNIHTLVNDFALFDNLYTDGEVSQCGHQWTDSAYANDYCEKQWILSYSRKGEVVSDKRLFASPEYIWTQARKHGRTARVYGEYVNLQEDHESAEASIVPKLEQLGFCAAWDKAWKAGARDFAKVDIFLDEMHKAEQTGKWWNLMVMALPDDHTHGLSPGGVSPRALVAGNDQAVGKLVEGVSHSKFWKDTAIFVIEDDAQDGPDHVDSHRTEGLVVSPYVRRNVVDSTHYTTSSMLRTMELMLGLPPMTEYDALATPMYAAFTANPDTSPYTLVAPKTNVEEKNPARGALEARSAKLDFSDIDRADPQELNHILWEAYRPGVPYPATVRTGFGRR